MKDLKDFSWSALFLVTGCSCFLFSAILKMLEGDYSKPLLWMGLAAFFFALLDYAGKLLAKTAATTKKRKRRSYSKEF